MKNILPACSIIALLLASGIAGCSSSSDNDLVSSDTQAQLQGVWEKSGYGLVLSISGRTVTAYDYTSATCVRRAPESLDDLALSLDSVDESGRAFTLRETPIGFSERYNQVAEIPVVCAAPIGNRPAEVFEHVWHTFNDYYAFFQERNVDWLAQYDAVRDLIHDGMSDDQLFSALSAMVQPIDDVHVSLTGSNDHYFSPGSPKGFFDEFIAEFHAQGEIQSLEDYFAQELNTALAIIDSVYLDGDVAEAGGPSDDFFRWGVIGDDIGYLSIGAFILQFDRSIADQLVEVESAIDQALTDLGQTRALIVDVRLTPGGADPIALAIASRFTDVERPVMRKHTRTIAGDGISESVAIRPSARVRYTQPVVVLTSGFSASATEVFTLAMRAIPQVTTVGEPTIGALSDILEKPLPNGWRIGLANEVYYDADENVFEVVGIPPDVEVSAFAKPEREMGQDSAINAALEALGFNFE